MSNQIPQVAAGSLPIIDIGALVQGATGQAEVARQIRDACRDYGFFYVTGHGVPKALGSSLESLSRQFFALPRDEKMAISMAQGGRAWRGYFAVGDELTSGRPDRKEGLYFGAELPDDHPNVRAGLALHGHNLFPKRPDLRQTVLRYIAALTELGHCLMRGISLALDLEPDYFHQRYTKDPLVLFRIFNYPHVECDEADAPWGVGEHTDYGILTILRQDNVGGLQVKSQGRWIEAPPIPGTFVCNIGDMLDRMTGGQFRSTPHRVQNVARQDRLSFPFFFDPNFKAEVQPIDPAAQLEDDARVRWDGASVHTWQGTYGDYLLSKVAKVFPDLGTATL